MFALDSYYIGFICFAIVIWDWHLEDFEHVYRGYQINRYVNIKNYNLNNYTRLSIFLDPRGRLYSLLLCIIM